MSKSLVVSVLSLVVALFISCKKGSPNPNDNLTIEQLNAPYVAPVQQAAVTFYSRINAFTTSGGGIDLYVDGNFMGTISNYVSTGVTPGCGSSYNVNTQLTVGNHTWYAFGSNGTNYGSASFPRSITVNTTSTCNKIEVF